MNNTARTVGTSSSRVDSGSNMDKANRQENDKQQREPLNDTNAPPATKSN
jgi:hypothetical protein